MQLKSYVFDSTVSYDAIEKLGIQFDSKNLKEYELWTDAGLTTVGVEGTIVADIYASYSSPAFWLQRLGTNWLIYNPNIFGEISVTAEGTL